MHHRAHLVAASTLFLCVGTALTAHAASVTEPPAPPQPIWGGDAVEECGWPTTVGVGGCTGTLVHPEVVVFAAHCMFFAGGQGPAEVTFGESTDVPQRTVATQSCTMFPGWVPDKSSFGTDVAFCELAEPVIDIPVVPVLMGCETNILQPDQPITLVGYGITDQQLFGVKHEVQTQVNGFEGDEINVGGGGTSSCNGDSGGPAYVQLEDGTWRVFGITSRGTSGSCADPSIYGLIHLHTDWIETTSGIDITPCHDADGTWNPSDGCTEFPLDPGNSDAAWPAGCAQARLSGPAATCGDPVGGGGSSSSGDPGDTGLDESAGEDTDAGSTTGLPGGTAGDTNAAGTTMTVDPQTSTGDAGEQDDDNVVTCTCRADAPAPRGAWLLLPVLMVLRRRQTS